MAMIDLDARDIGRLLVGVRSRIGKLKKGIARFGDGFDPTKGKNMIASLDAHEALQRRLMEAQDECNEDTGSCEPTEHRNEREGRRQ